MTDTVQSSTLGGLTVRQNVGQGHLPGIDSIRAFAVLSVIIYHLDPRVLPGGFVGVDVFFVISGFVITRSLAARTYLGARDFFAGFYRRRILRIAPALFVYVAVFTVVSTQFMPTGWLSADSDKMAAGSIFGVSNIVAAITTDGYFTMRTPFNPFMQTWSLGVEEQFYLVFPLLLLAFLLLRRSGLRPRIVLGWAALTTIAGASLLYSWPETAAAPSQAFFLLPSRMWELLLGVLTYLLLRYCAPRLGAQLARFALLLGGLGGVLLIASVIFATEDSFPFYWAIPPTVGTALLLVAADRARPGSLGAAGRVLLARPVRYVGLISYSLYLWHWGVFVLFRWTVGLEGVLTQALALAIVFAAAGASYAVIERPILRSRPLKALSNARVLLLGSIAAVLVVALVILLRIPWKGALDAAPWADPALQTSFALPAGAENLAAGKTVFLLGDSHADHLSYAADVVVSAMGGRLMLISSPGCAVLGLTGTALPACAATGLAALQPLMKPGDVVIFSNLNVPRISDQWAANDPNEVLQQNGSPAAAASRRQDLEAASTALLELKNRGVKVLYVAPTPVFGSPPFRCVDWFNSMNPICASGFTSPRVLQSELRSPVMGSLKTLVDRDLATVWDPFNEFCSAAYCSAAKDSFFVFRDQDHLSKAGNQLLLRPLADVLTRLLGSHQSQILATDYTQATAPEADVNQLARG
jgi:peptidoglycan/LPS O-acetylase OafA/YrhL